MKIISSSNRRAIRLVVERSRTPDATTARRVTRIVDAVRLEGDRALRAYAQTFDRVTGSLEVTPLEIRRGAREAPLAVRTAIRQAARHIRHVAKRQLPKGWRTAVIPGVVIENRVAAAGARRLLRAWGTLSTTLLFADDGDPCPGRRRTRDHRHLPPP